MYEVVYKNRKVQKFEALGMAVEAFLEAAVPTAGRAVTVATTISIVHTVEQRREAYHWMGCSIGPDLNKF